MASPMKMHTGAQCGNISSKHCRASGSLGHMQLRQLVPVFSRRFEFTPISPMAQGGQEKVDTISGRPETHDQSGRWLFVRTAGHSGCSAGRPTSHCGGDR
jgi:hypothetical protein